MEKTIRIMRNIVCFPIWLYQVLLSPFIKPSCRFYPSCSEYTKLAILSRGIPKGIGMGVYRILRCHPWSAGGYDPILPEHKEND